MTDGDVAKTPLTLAMLRDAVKTLKKHRWHPSECTVCGTKYYCYRDGQLIIPDSPFVCDDCQKESNA